MLRGHRPTSAWGPWVMNRAISASVTARSSTARHSCIVGEVRRKASSTPTLRVLRVPRFHSGEYVDSLRFARDFQRCPFRKKVARQPCECRGDYAARFPYIDDREIDDRPRDGEQDQIAHMRMEPWRAPSRLDHGGDSARRVCHAGLRRRGVTRRHRWRIRNAQPRWG